MLVGIVSFVLRRPIVTGALLFVSLIVSGWIASQLQVRFQYRDFYVFPDNHRMPTYDRYTNDFGDSGKLMVVMIEAADVFEPRVLRYVSELTRALEHAPEFVDIRSLANVSLVRAQGDTVLSGRLMPEVPATEADAQALKESALGSPILVRTLVSKTGQATALLADMRDPQAVSSIVHQRRVVAALNAILAAHPAPSGVTIRTSGQPVVEIETTDTLTRELLRLTPLTLTVLALLLFVTFRTMRSVFLVLATVTVSLVWTAAVFVSLGRAVDIFGSIIPTVLLVYGAVDPIFVLTRYLGKLRVGLARKPAITEAMRELAMPCLLTSATTALGFAAFASADLPTVRYFGIVLAIGVMLAFVTTITVLPLLLLLGPESKPKEVKHSGNRMLDRSLVKLWRFLEPRRGAVIVVSLLLTLGGGWAASRTHISNVYVALLPEGKVLSATRAIETHLSGIIRAALYLEGPADSMNRPEVLQALSRVGAAARNQPIVTTALSVADLVAEANQAFEGGDAAARVVPQSKSLIAQYLTLLDPATRDRFVKEDYSRAQLQIMTVDHGSEPMRDMVAALQRVVEQQGFDRMGIKTVWTSTGVMAYEILDELVVEVLWGFVYAFAIAVLLQWALFRSLRVALTGIIPNLIPVGACAVVILILGYTLRSDNGLFLCISIGGLFNTTIHIAARVSQQVKAGVGEPNYVMEQSLRAVGPASFYIATILSLGFAVLVSSDFPGLRELGILSMVTLLVAFFSDAIFTSVLLRDFFPWPRSQREQAKPWIDRVQDTSPAASD